MHTDVGETLVSLATMQNQDFYIAGPLIAAAISFQHMGEVMLEDPFPRVAILNIFKSTSQLCR